MKRILRIWTLLALAITALCTGRAQAAPGERCFAETGFCISGNIRAYWEQNGGLLVFGYPISTQRPGTIEGTPAGKYVPTRGFGKLWRADASVRDGLGFATEREQGDSGDVLYYDGAKIIHSNSNNQVFVLHPDHTVETTSVR